KMFSRHKRLIKVWQALALLATQSLSLIRDCSPACWGQAPKAPYKMLAIYQKINVSINAFTSFLYKYERSE
ncbi:hypothetical protein, partial [Staphylococcus sp. GDY8P57P]